MGAERTIRRTAEQAADRVRRIATQLREAERPVRVLTTIEWPAEVRDRFFADGARELPRPTYTPLDPALTMELTAAVYRELDLTAPIDAWLGHQAVEIETTARMLAAVGTPEFSRHSGALYGRPTDVLRDEESTPLDLARMLDDRLSLVQGVDLGAPPSADLTAEVVAAQLRTAVAARFGPEAPEVVVEDRLSANALAGPTRIRLRRDARFTDRDVHQLIEHEAHVHVATSLNGRAQADLPILAAPHPGTTRTQEGLAVFAELIGGTLDPDRFRRLADRVLAIQMAITGADFLDVYRFFLERTDSPDQSFENARRVFRGGVVTGGAPFTKDVVYLDGLLRVHNFLRAVVANGRSDCMRLLFCGKIDIDDIPALCHLAAMGLVRAPRFVPPWAADRRFLVTYLAYSGFLDRVNLTRVRAHYDALLAEAPRVAGG
jgi:uncharacterized protein (TIGR02421 family)